MPQLYRIGEFRIYFWMNEGDPLEPIHVHVSKGTPSGNSTKIWITETGNCVLQNNNSRIPVHQLNDLMRIIESLSDEIIEKWIACFGGISYYC